MLPVPMRPRIASTSEGNTMPGQLSIATVASAIALAAAAPARAASPSPSQCSGLAVHAFSQTTITSATWQPAASSLPEHCRVQGVIGPGTIGFAVQLPSDWNGKLYHAG